VKISELEFHVIAYLAEHPDREGYGWAITKWLKEQLALKVALGSVYRKLAALWEKGLVERRLGEPHESVAGCERHYYKLNPAGYDAFRMACQDMKKLMERLRRSIEGGERGLGVHERVG